MTKSCTRKGSEDAKNSHPRYRNLHFWCLSRLLWELLNIPNKSLISIFALHTRAIPQLSLLLKNEFDYILLYEWIWSVFLPTDSIRLQAFPVFSIYSYIKMSSSILFWRLFTKGDVSRVFQSLLLHFKG